MDKMRKQKDLRRYSLQDIGNPVKTIDKIITFQVHSNNMETQYVYSPLYA